MDRSPGDPRTPAVVLGSGMGAAFSAWEVEETIPFEAIPGLGSISVSGHEGWVRACSAGGKRLLVVSGRRHYYEGEPGFFRSLATFLASRGVGTLILASASGSLGGIVLPGELVVVEDIVDLQFRKRATAGPPALPGDREPAPLGDPSRGVLSERPVLSRRTRLDPVLSRRLYRAGVRAGIPVHRGVMGVVSGPNYETASEVRALRRLGVSIVTMSAAPEAEAAAGAGMSVAALGVVTNLACPVSSVPLSHDEVRRVASSSTGKLEGLITEFLDMP